MKCVGGASPDMTASGIFKLRLHHDGDLNTKV
jgi:hypothetical protein